MVSKSVRPEVVPHGRIDVQQPTRLRNPSQDDARIFWTGLIAETEIKVPQYLSGDGDWVEHIPFAFWLVSVLRPGILVELGAPCGDSYLSFCQAVKQLGLETRCYAVETWEGEHHRGRCRDAVFDRLKKNHDEDYGGFSSLIGSNFDDARNFFRPESVDLLHIDAFESYETVKHHFEAWHPLMKESGVVLFHDTNVRGPGFGVWSFWEEISQEYPRFEFHHGHGLGVLLLGPGVPRPLAELFRLSMKPEALWLRSHFATLGRSLSLRRQVQRLSSSQTDEEADPQSAGEDFQSRMDRLNRLPASRDDDAGRLQQRLVEKERSIQILRRALTESDLRVSDLERRLAEQRRANAFLCETVSEHHDRIAALEGTLAQCQREIGSIYTETSRLSAPLRVLMRGWDRVRSQAGKWVRAVYLSLPFPMSLKLQAKGLAFAALAPLLRNTASYQAWLTFEARCRNTTPDGGACTVFGGDSRNTGLRDFESTGESSSATAELPGPDHFDPAVSGREPPPAGTLQPAIGHFSDEIRSDGVRPSSRILSHSISPFEANRYLPPLLPARLAEAPCQIRVLFVDGWMPTPDRSSGSFRFLEILKALRGLGFFLTLAVHRPRKFHETIDVFEPDLARYENLLCELSVELIYGEQELLAHLATEGQRYSHVWLNFPEVAREYLPWVRAYAVHARVIFDSIDLHHIRYARQAEVTGDPAARRKADFYRRLEKLCCESSDITIAITEDERAQLLELSPASRIELIPNIHPACKLVSALPSRKNLLFVGGFSHQPNVDAVHYFVAEIFPLLRNRLPSIEFLIVGSNMPESVSRLAVPGVRAIGYVEDLDACLQQARVFVAPLRYGAGMKGKLGQALSAGLPSVTTAIGAEGMYLCDEQQVMIADTPDRFAEAVFRLCTDDELWNRLSQHGIRHIEEHFSPEAIRDRLRTVFASA